MKRLNRKGQGTTEYVIIVGVIVLIAVALGTKFSPAVQSAISNIASQITSATGGGGNP